MAALPSYYSISGTFASFPSTLQNVIQQGFIEREFEEGLASVLAYAREALLEVVPARVGETLTRTRIGWLVPNPNAISPAAANLGLDNGLTPQQFALEQYTYVMKNYAGTFDLNLLQERAAAADVLIADERRMGVQAAQTLDILAQNALFAAYLGGNTRVRGDIAVSTTTSCHVDDIRGFSTVLVNGAQTPVSGASPLTAYEYPGTTSGTTQTLQITGAAADAINSSSVPSGISGVLTFNAVATAPVSGDAIISSVARKPIRPRGEITTAQLKRGSNFSTSMILDGVARLRLDGVPTMKDGTYHLIMDDYSQRQLFADQDFKVWWAGREQSTEVRNGYIVPQLLGVTFITTTQAIPQAPYIGNNAVGTAIDAPNQVTATVRRPILLGGECLLRGDFEGLEDWINRQGINPIGTIALINGIAHSLRPPIDRAQQIVSGTWWWVGGFVCPTDATATPSIIPTASNALVKRAVVFEHAS